jgi:hypothetical protein
MAVKCPGHRRGVTLARPEEAVDDFGFGVLAGLATLVTVRFGALAGGVGSGMSTGRW